jgi:hypothetical protein
VSFSPTGVRRRRIAGPKPRAVRIPPSQIL